MQINLEFMSKLAECQQNFHLPEHMKEGSRMYTYFSYPVTSFFIPQMANNPISYAAITTLKCSTSRLHNNFKCLWNCECYVPCCASSCLFTYFGFFGSHYNSSVCSVMSRLQNVESQYQHIYWKVLTAELLELRAISPNC